MFLLLDLRVLLVGGYNNSRIASSELYPPSCAVPSLPLGGIVGSVTFLSPWVSTWGSSGQIVSCGGVVSGCDPGCSSNDATHQCFALNMDWKNEFTGAVGRWESSVVGNLNRPRWRASVVSLPGVGVYVLGGIVTSDGGSSDFLPAGETSWQEGPGLPIRFYHSCAVAISSTRFLIIRKDTDDGQGIWEFDLDHTAGVPTDNSGWRPADTWPNLLSRRYMGHGCAVIGSTLVVAGGGSGDARKTTEIIDLEAKTVRRGQDMLGIREWFQLFTVASPGSKPSLLAVGGWISSVRDTLKTVEEWDPETETWREANGELMQARSDYGAVVVDNAVVCG